MADNEEAAKEYGATSDGGGHYGSLFYGLARLEAWQALTSSVTQLTFVRYKLNHNHA